MKKVITYISYTHFMWAAIICILVITSCAKTPIEPVEVYPDAPKPLVRFEDTPPFPGIGSEGTLVTYKINGLAGKNGQFKFYMNQQEAEVVSIDSNLLKVKVPPNASSGGCHVIIDGQYYFGPTFTVRGKIYKDPLFLDTYQATIGAAGTGLFIEGEVAGILAKKNGDYLIYGNFDDYQTQASPANKITNIAVLDQNGAYRTSEGSQLKMGAEGFNQPISSFNELADGSFVVAGTFTEYDTLVKNLGGLATLNADGTVKTKSVDVINPDPILNPDDNTAVVASFNGGVVGGILKAFVNIKEDTSIIVVGNFNNYRSIFYDLSTKDGPYFDQIQARQIIKMNKDGVFDSTFNFNIPLNQSYSGANGFINDVIQLTDGKIIMVGNFTSYNDGTSRRVNYITAINPATGKVDQSFNTGIGANNVIDRITYNATTQKILLTGSFSSFNGLPANGVVMLNQNGSVDNAFSFRNFEGGYPNFAGQLDKGKIIVSGTFVKYDNIVRPGFMVLNPDGSLAQGYNNTGYFRGNINQILKAQLIDGVQTYFIVGGFDRFDNTPVGNIVKVRIEE